MLYERWRQVAQQHPREVALRDLALGLQWTFRQLAEEAERSPEEAGGALAHPQGHDLNFILTVLRAWRRRRVVCPLEPGQSPPRPHDLPRGTVHLKTTSATTGTPRGVAFTAEQLAADADHIVATKGLRRDWPNLGIISLAHSYGFSNLVTPLLLHGIPLVLARSPLPEALRRAASVLSDFTLPAVPAMWRAWHEAGAIPRHLRRAISAGAPLPLALEQAVFESTGVKIHNFYGSTECGGIAYDASETPRADASFVGTPLRHVRLAINPNGCVEVHSAAVGLTYWPEASPHLGHGCFRTSDLGEIIDGGVYLRGRVSDQINIAGRKVSPEAIERVLLTHPGVKDCLVFGVPSAHEGRGEEVVACVVPRAQPTEEQLEHWLHERLPDWQVPREWRFVESLAVNQRGKISRAEWRDKIRHGKT